jgi:hypothetical protein
LTSTSNVIQTEYVTDLRSKVSSIGLSNELSMGGYEAETKKNVVLVLRASNFKQLKAWKTILDDMNTQFK